jgi:lysophospholipase L1-like esterase
MGKKILLVFFIVPLTLTTVLQAQKKIVIMGSSSAVGTGASSYANSWAGKIEAYFRQNMQDGRDTITTNIAIGGYNSYLEMPSSYVPPPNRPLPDANANVTRALGFFPDVVIINLPSNDVTAGFPSREIMDNFRFMYAAFTAAHVRCFITTTQPRSLDAAGRETLRALKDSVLLNFGSNAIDFFTGTADVNLFIKQEYNSGDGTHFNDLGYSYVFNQVKNKPLFPSNAALPLTVTSFQVQSKNNTTIIKWHADQEEANTFYEIQRSATGLNFETLYRQVAFSTGLAADYSWTDQHPLSGKSFYRLKINEPAKESYSKTISVFSKTSDLYISKLYKDNSSSNLIVEIGVQKNQFAVISIISISGSVIQTKAQYLAGPSDQIILPISGLASGQYFLSIRGSDNGHSVKAFSKE